ncbi:hypothetical protein BRC81_11785 [Halobacteriales archaeon QS_1_68_20]|nr:MAG: hypothetical protein BRC81_11785 [Halobacteriales archaeon QS_1_68_20]
MDDLRAATESLLDDKPELEGGLRSVLAVDDERGSWTFEDVPLDSGEFGEIVSRDIVVETDDGYRIADRAAVETALGVEPADGEDRSAAESGVPDSLDELREFVPSVDRRVATFLGLALALVVLFRIVPYGAVFRNGDVVLSANDPYAYRYVVEQMAATTSGPFDVGVLSDLPELLPYGEPLLVTTLWWVTEVLGGGARTAGLVLAWYPVVSAAITGVFTYALATRVTDDRRVGIAAVTFLAITPLHAIRTGVGFADHHPFDYVWLVLTALALVALVGRDPCDRRTWGWTAVLGVAVGAQVLAWDNGPLLLIPVAIYALLRAVSDVRAGESPLRGGLPVAAGAAVAAAIVGLAHVRLGWHTSTVAATPAVLLGGVVGVFLLAEAVSRLGGSARHLLVAQAVGGVAALLVLRRTFPAFASALDRGTDRLFAMDAIVESSSLFGGHFQWLIGPLVFFGFALVLVVLYMAWAGWRTYREHDPALLVAAVYAWFLFALTTLQIRFAGEFAPFAAVFAGLGFVHLASWVELARTPAPFRSSGPGPADPAEPSDGDLVVPERRAAIHVAGLWLGVGSLGGAMSAVKHTQVTTEGDAYDVAKWIAGDADERGLEYPENYVLSRWGTNRLYNYFVNGESLRYAYAKSNYDEFLQGTDPGRWYERIGGRVGYLVVDPDYAGGVYAPDSTYFRLAIRHGSRGESAPGTGHYRARYVSDEGRKVFELVPGAVVVAEEASGTVSTEVEIPGASFTYERRLRSDGETGRVRVAYPGRYEVGDGTVDVSEAAVRNGETVRPS